MEKSSARWQDLPSAALFSLCVLLAAWRLAATNWIETLDAVATLTLLGAIVGLALGAAKFGRRGVGWLALGYTLTLLPRQLLAVYYNENIYLGERLAGLGGRLLFTVGEFAAERPIQDPLFFFTLISALYWCMALFSGYQLSRHNNTLAAVLPAGLAALVIHHFDRFNPGRAWLIAAYFSAALVLIGRGQYLRDRRAWLRRGVQMAPETGPDLSLNLMVSAVALVVLAWNLPLNFSSAPLQDAWETVARPWRATRERWEHAFDALRGGSPAAPSEFFGSAMTLGTQAAQGTDLALIVHIPILAEELPRLYWRARVYDRYEAGGWRLSDPVKEEFHPEAGALPIPDLAGRKEFEFRIVSYTRGQAIFSLASQPLWTSRPAAVSYFPLENGQRDALAFEAVAFMEPGDVYRARAAVADPSIEELRAAGQEYPDWAASRYLQLPENFSERLRDFAERETRGLATPYDKVQAITDILRTTIRYKSSVPAPPENADVLEWFFFDLKEGYCNYYATVETLMLRSLGIPARMAVGYSQGEPAQSDEEFSRSRSAARAYNVYRKNMHAWPEVYFPGIGWVEFEPTANQEPILRPEKHAAAPQPERNEIVRNPIVVLQEEPDDAPVPSPVPLVDWRRWLAPLLWAAALILGAAAWRYANRKYPLATRAAEFILAVAERRGGRFPAWLRNLALYALASPFERAFQDVNRSLRWLRKNPSANLTPAERAALLKTELPEASQDIDLLLREYQSAQFSQHGGDLRLARRAGRRILREGMRARVRQVMG